jgi:Chaperone of endosialidase
MNTLRLKFTALAMCTFGTSFAQVPVTSPTPHSVAVGAGALTQDILPGDYNTAVGVNALAANTWADQSVAVGTNALAANTIDGGHVAVGYEALGTNNVTNNVDPSTAVGYFALGNNVSGGSNTAVGLFALQGAASASGSFNTAAGSNALQSNTSGSGNVAFGVRALAAETSGSNNTSVGVASLRHVTSGSNNVAIGYYVGSATLRTGSNNVLIGTTPAIDTAAAGTSNTIQVGAGSTAIWSVTGTGNPATAVETFTGSIAFPNVTTGTNANFVCMAAGNVLTRQSTACTISSLRFKEHVRPFSGNALPEIEQLEVDSYNMQPTAEPNPDPNFGSTQIGLIAENIAKVVPACAIYENDMATPKSYRQECVIALLVKAVQEQQREIAKLKRQIKHH